MTEGELFYEYIIEAFQAFAENHAEFSPKFPISFDTKAVDKPFYFVSCKVESTKEGEVFCVNISHNTVDGLKADLNLNQAEDRYIFKLRTYWLIHHEIAHWIWGHIAFYTEMGWTTELGLIEAKNECSVKPLPKSTDFDLAHAAELQADTFAVIELFNLISREDDGDNYDRFVTAYLVLYSIMTTIALFYEGKRDQQPSRLHPTWKVRSVNLLRTVFECFLIDCFGENAMSAGLRITAAALNPVLDTFADKAFLPALESSMNYAKANDLSETLFELDGKGLLNPQRMIALMCREEGYHPDVDELIELYEKANEWIALLDTYSPVNNFVPVAVFGETKTSNPNSYSYKLASILSKEAIATKLDIWAQTNKIKIHNIEYYTTPESIDDGRLVDIDFQTDPGVSSKNVMTLVRNLQIELS